MVLAQFEIWSGAILAQFTQLRHFLPKNGAVPDDLRLRRQMRVAEMALSVVRKNPQEPA